jgi:hypothetical protein
LNLSRTTEWLWVLGACAFLHLFYSSLQPVTGSHEGLAFDGQHYFAMAQQTPRHLPPHADAPFVYRIGTPMAAAAIAKSLDWVLAEGFDVVNRTSAVITVVLFALWLRRHLQDASLRILMIVFFMIAPHLPMRFAYFYPINVDSAALMFLMMGLVALDLLEDQWTSLRLLLVAAIVGVGVVFREIVLVIGLAAVVRHLAFPKDRRRWASVVPLLAGLMIYSAIRAWVMPTPSTYGETAEVMRWLRQKTVIQVIVAWLLTFGPALILAVCRMKTSLRSLLERPDWAVIVVVVGALAIVGGSDTERVLVFTAPLVFLLIGRAWATTPFGLTSVAGFLLVSAQLLMARVFLPLGTWTMPHVAGTEWNRVPSVVRWLSTYESLWTQFCGPVAIRWYLVWFGALTVIVVAALRREAINQRRFEALE